jgi:thiol-disulfide isomerase/thioredoxin/YHS domain-containing protein
MIRACALLLCAASLVVTNQRSAVAQEIAWSEDVEASLQHAAAAGRPVLMEFTADWCVYCKRMEKTTFTDPAVAARVAEKFIAVRVDADKHKDLVSELGIKGLPAILIVSPELQILERISGYQTPAALVARLDKIPSSTSQSTAATAPARAGMPVASTRPRPPRPSTPAPEANRNELQFEAISQEEAPQAGQPRRGGVRTVSRPAVSDSPVDPAASPATENSFEDFLQSQSRTAATASQDAAGTFDVTASVEERSVPPIARNAVQPAAEQADPSERPRPATNSGPAFGGHCLVTAVASRELVAGDPRIATTWRGRRLYFQSREHKQQFLDEPARYWPMLNGQCAMTLLEEDRETEGQLEFAAIFRQRVWLFASEAAMREFLEDPAGVIEELQEEAEQRK